jgi:DNA-binding HxlR family transcriptional regulator
MTHVLVEPAPQIIEALQGAAMTLNELSEALQVDGRDQPVLAERLAELEETGLIARA